MNKLSSEEQATKRDEDKFTKIKELDAEDISVIREFLKDCTDCDGSPLTIDEKGCVVTLQ
jgi:hypothetical protein